MVWESSNNFCNKSSIGCVVFEEHERSNLMLKGVSNQGGVTDLLLAKRPGWDVVVLLGFQKNFSEYVRNSNSC